MRQPKYLEIAESFERRIHSGDYAFSTMPGAHKLASEMGVSYMTARKAVKHLIDSGVVERQDTGRLQVKSKVIKSRGPMVAMITPFWNFSSWHMSIRKEVASCNGTLRIVAYAHNDDPIISEALDGDFDIFFVMLPSDNPGPMLIDRLKKIRKKVVILFNDMTEFGFRSLIGAPMSQLELMMDKLIESGHKRIDCINTQPLEKEIQLRIAVWKQAVRKHSVAGNFYNHPVEPFNFPVEPAYKHAREILQQGNVETIFCTTVDLVSGVYLACWELGIKPGEDISIFSFGEYERAKMLAPPLATVVSPDPGPVVRKLIEDILDNNHERLLYNPDGAHISWGKSIKNCENGELKHIN